jgi:hypothetical protein
LNQHEFVKDYTQQQIEDIMLATLKESIRECRQMISVCCTRGRTQFPSGVRGVCSSCT